MLVKAIMIDPAARTVSGIEVPVALYPDEPDAGPQVNFKDLYPLIGCDSVELFYLPNGRDAGLIDAEGLYRNNDFCQRGGVGSPAADTCMITMGKKIKTIRWQAAAIKAE